MARPTLSDGEWKLMNLLWDESPETIGEMVEAMRGDTGWTKATINIMLNRLADKGAVRVDDSGRRKLFYPLLSRDEAVRDEARSTLTKIRTGGIGLLVSTVAQECEMSDEEIEELYRLLKDGRRGHD